MYTIKIESINKENGRPYASVSFTRDTGETEQYRELVEVTPAVPEERDPETDEVIVEFQPAVMDYTPFMTRPKLEVIHENFYFTSQAELDSQILAKKNLLEQLQEAAGSVTVGEYTPVEPEPPVGNPVTVIPTPEQVFVTTVNRLKNALAMAAVGTLKGNPPNAQNEAFIAGGLQYIQATVTEHPEYLDLVDLSALLPLLKP